MCLCEHHPWAVPWFHTQVVHRDIGCSASGTGWLSKPFSEPRFSPLQEEHHDCSQRGKKKPFLYQPGDKIHLVWHQKKEKCP